MESEALLQQATVNTRDQFMRSPALQRIGEDAAIEAMDSYDRTGQRLFSDKAKFDKSIDECRTSERQETSQPTHYLPRCDSHCVNFDPYQETEI